MDIDIVVDVKTILGEGPVWDVDTQRLYFIDSKGDHVFRTTVVGSEVRSWEVPGHVGSMAVRKDGDGAIVALQQGLHTLDFATGRVELIVDPEPDLPNNRLNDGKVDQAGRFVVGSMDTLELGASGNLFSLAPDFSLQKLEENIIVSNGPCWSPDGSIFYFTDSWSGEIWKYDYDLATGTATNRSTFTKPTFLTAVGAPDGSTVDSEGFLWNAQVYEGLLVRYAPSGEIDATYEMPVKNITSVMFGGSDLDTLFVTSMGRSPAARFPVDGVQRGSVFAVSGLGATGVPEPRFGA